MKRLLLLSVFVLATVFMNSCGGGFKSEVKKVASYFCEMKDLVDKGAKENKEKLKKLAQKAAEIGKKIETKYKDKDKKEAQAIMMKALKKCGLGEEKLFTFIVKLSESGINLNM